MALQVSGQAHALMQDAHYSNIIGPNPIHDYMRANQPSAVCHRQIIPYLAEMRIMPNGLQGRIDLVAIDQQLRFTPFFAGIAQNVDEILPRQW